MSRGIGVAGVVSVLVMVMLFSRWNGAERVTLDLGVWTLYRVPVIYVAFVSLLVGMAVMLLAGLHSDLKIRKFLRERFEEEGRDEAEFRDRYQRDLFLDEEEIPTFASATETHAGEPTEEVEGEEESGPYPP
ncbi:MAG: hypothetical protein EA351_10320 [Gemmatimonadales bacterium]|nr:MAG: hypothetical protein EA351_10320 [Gemmatimonadales bacterium]